MGKAREFLPKQAGSPPEKKIEKIVMQSHFMLLLMLELWLSTAHSPGHVLAQQDKMEVNNSIRLLGINKVVTMSCKKCLYFWLIC